MSHDDPSQRRPGVPDRRHGRNLPDAIDDGDVIADPELSRERAQRRRRHAGVTIAKPALGWTASSWKGKGYTSVCQPGTPLNHCLKLRTGRFGNHWKAELLDDSDPADLFTDDPMEGSH